MAVDLDTVDMGTIYALLCVRDDTEEDLVGSDLHQDAITEAHAGIATYRDEHGLSWYVTKQVMMTVWLPGYGEWHPSPDVYVVPGVSGHPRSSYDARVEPVPPFALEVISPMSVDRDARVKRHSYELIGVREYIIFDPTGEELGSAVRAWHQDPGRNPDDWPRWVPWEPDESGTWRSASLGLGFRPEGVLLRVQRPDGSLVETRGEMTRRVAELEEELRRLRGGLS